MKRDQWLLAIAAALGFATGHWYIGAIATVLCVADGFIKEIN